MTTPVDLSFIETSLDEIAEREGHLAVCVASSGKLDQTARRLNRLLKGAVERFADSEQFDDMEVGGLQTLRFPSGVVAQSVHVIKLDRRPSQDEARKAGVSLGKTMGKSPLTVLAGNLKHADQLALGVMLRAYNFQDHKSSEPTQMGAVQVMVSKPDEETAKLEALRAVAEGVFFTRDLVAEPANILTTTEFADRLKALETLGLEVEVLDEPELEKLGMRTLLSVGQGSDSPSKVVVMKWNGGGDEAPFAFVGKGVVFDTGGISLKPAGGMEDMTMDMGGAGVVAGVMKTLAMRKAKANVVGLVGLVENMPSGNATRPGDIVRSMKGDTVEIINTDAEGRLVLADVLWYAQERFKPTGVINLATLTGAIIIGLGHENAGVFSNDDTLANDFLAAASAENEGAWRMPMGPSYDKLIKSQLADMKNVGGRGAGSITAAQFLQRFVKDDTPWIHLDIAGVASVKADTTYAPKGATGWGVMALNRLIADQFES
ncbi:leucyl aminopeptidase [Nereida sp. MMG025]|uniref:leucyl aminopeptidase n=1 Tax=Nereida sp. MMG025 TaxID=2909981 RepID=UPI001F02E326|nr:leucyl aminopeptidase [Nereida sp. MMG025]MCF6443441.1 leucyl aminopeptidase [Nereida sp. MMG025]